MNFRALLTSFAAVALIGGAGLAQPDVSQIPALEDGVFTFVVSGEYPPFSMPAEDGTLEGFDLDLGQAIADYLGVESDPQQAQFSGIIAGIQSGRFDASIADHARTPERDQAVTFLDIPYYYSGAQVFVPSDSPYESLEEIAEAGEKIAVDRGGTNQQWLEDNGYGDTVATYSGVPESITAIQAGQAAAIFTSPIVGNQAINTTGADLVAVGGLVFEENAWITIADDQPELKAALEEALQSLRDDGTMLEISQEWIGGDIVTPPAE